MRVFVFYSVNDLQLVAGIAREDDDGDTEEDQR